MNSPGLWNGARHSSLADCGVGVCVGVIVGKTTRVGFFKASAPESAEGSFVVIVGMGVGEMDGVGETGEEKDTPVNGLDGPTTSACCVSISMINVIVMSARAAPIVIASRICRLVLRIWNLCIDAPPSLQI